MMRRSCASLIEEYVQGDSPQRDHDSQINRSLNWNNFVKVWPHIWSWALSLGGVYCFEYTIITAFGNKSTEGLRNSENDYEKNVRLSILLLT